MPAPVLNDLQLALVARGECACGCGHELPWVTVDVGGGSMETVVQPGRCYIDASCRSRAHRQRQRESQFGGEALRDTRMQQARALQADAERLEERATALRAKAARLTDRARGLSRRAAAS